MKPTVIITAANGFIGETLVDFLKRDYRLVALVRTPQPSTKEVTYITWDGKIVGDWSHEFEHALAVVNLAGKSVNCRYNEKNKADIYASRLESTTAIGEAINRCTHKPEVWINAASATIYAHSLYRPNTETNNVIGTGFSVDVCQQWEACFNGFEQPGVRQLFSEKKAVLWNHSNAWYALALMEKWAMDNSNSAGYMKQMCVEQLHFLLKINKQKECTT